MAHSKAHARNLRKGRHSQVGGYYFLTATVAGRRDIFSDSTRARMVLDAIRWLRLANRIVVDAAVVMPDHLHMAGHLGTGLRQDAAPTSGSVGGPSGPGSRQDAAPTLASVMHTFKSYTANRLSRSGVLPPVWQAGYHDHALRDDEDYRVRVRYLLQNPVRAGLVPRAEDYPYLVLPEWWVPE